MLGSHGGWLIAVLFCVGSCLQVNFALERGIPAMLGILATRRLPFPARSFDLAHCSGCLIPWTAYGEHHLCSVPPSTDRGSCLVGPVSTYCQKLMPVTQHNVASW